MTLGFRVICVRLFAGRCPWRGAIDCLHMVACSTALVCALMGAAHGLSAIPTHWVEGLEDSEQIVRLVLAWKHTQPTSNHTRRARNFVCEDDMETTIGILTCRWPLRRVSPQTQLIRLSKLSKETSGDGKGAVGARVRSYEYDRDLAKIRPGQHNY